MNFKHFKDDGIFQGNKSSKILGGVSIVINISAVIFLFRGHWIAFIFLVLFATLLDLFAYKITGGRENSSLYSDFDLFELIAYAHKSANLQIGFHSSRNQDEIIKALDNAGCRVTYENRRALIRKRITHEREAFNACRQLIVIQIFYNNTLLYWDGFGIPKPPSWFLEAEIILNLNTDTKAVEKRFLELLLPTSVATLNS
jgi:hypothetical protein